jgi:hypothetical protein
MHIENESVKIVTIGDHEFEEIVEKYEEEILVQDEVPELPLTDSTNTVPAQGKPQCMTSIFHIHRIYIYMCCAFTLQEFYGNYMHIFIYILRVLLVQVRVDAMLRLLVAWVTCCYSQLGEYYYYSLDKMMEIKW